MASEILDRILADIKAAMKAQDREKLLALRTLHSDIKNLAINERREPSDEDAANVIARAIKIRQEALEEFKKGGRDDLVKREQFQIDLFRAYQPAQLGEAEIEALVSGAIRETGASSKKDIGAVMKALMPKVKGKADGKLVNTIVARKLDRRA